MIYRGPGFLAVLRFCSTPTPSPLFRQQLVSLSQFFCVSPVELTEGSGGGEGMGAKQKSYVLYKSFNALCFMI